MADQPAAKRKREKLAGCPVLAWELSRPPVQITAQYFVKLKILECLSFIYNSVRSQKNLNLKFMSQTHITDLLWVGPIQIWAVPCKVSRPENVH